jgi:UDP-N-acetylmuramoylalanine-D-glutamate ligase
MPLSGIPLKGEHNVENVLAAVVRRAPGRRARPRPFARIEKFQAVEHRLEYVATRNGVEFYNDSKATNVDATAKAVAAFNRGIHLILGGKDKGSDYTQLAPLLRERVRAVYTIGAARPRSSRTCAAWSPSTPAKPWTRPSPPPPPPRAPARWCCSRPPAPASTSSKTTSIAAACLKNWSTSGAASAVCPSLDIRVSRIHARSLGTR